MGFSLTLLMSTSVCSQILSSTLAATNPFTLFLTTEAGRHFSLTLNSEESLGKTIELTPQQPLCQSKYRINCFQKTLF